MKPAADTNHLLAALTAQTKLLGKHTRTQKRNTNDGLIMHPSPSK